MRHSVRLQLDLWKVGRLRMIREVLSSYDPTGSQGVPGRKFVKTWEFSATCGEVRCKVAIFQAKIWRCLTSFNFFLPDFFTFWVSALVLLEFSKRCCFERWSLKSWLFRLRPRNRSRRVGEMKIVELSQMPILFSGS